MSLTIKETKVPIMIQGGSLTVPKSDSLIPSKLRMLADSGWTIIGAQSVKEGGFELLLCRPMPEVLKSTALVHVKKSDPIHIGGPRCPLYCHCLVNGKGD